MGVCMTPTFQLEGPAGTAGYGDSTPLLEQAA